MRRNGVSQLLAIVITIAIALSAGAFIFAWANSLIRTGSVQHEVTVSYARLSYTPGSGWYITVVVKNTGTTSTSDVRLRCTFGAALWDNTLGRWAWRSEGRIVGSLSPGQSYSHSWRIRYVGIGGTYSFIIRVWFNDGAYKEYLISLRAEQG